MTVTGDHPREESVPVTLARLEGKVDAALAAQGATQVEHGRRLDVVDTRLNAHAAVLDDHSLKLAAMPAPIPRASGLQIASLVIAGVVGLGSLAGLAITLMQLVAAIPQP